MNTAVAASGVVGMEQPHCKHVSSAASFRGQHGIEWVDTAQSAFALGTSVIFKQPDSMPCTRLAHAVPYLSFVTLCQVCSLLTPSCFVNCAAFLPPLPSCELCLAFGRLCRCVCWEM